MHTLLREATKKQEIALRNSQEVKASVEAVRNGDISQKAKNYYRVPQAIAKSEFTTSVKRCVSELRSNGKVLLDCDKIGSWKTILETVRGREEELGILHIEKSARYGCHLTVRQIAGLTIDETIEWFEKEFGIEFDHSFKNISQPCYLVPNTDVLYVHDGYWAKVVEPNRSVNVDVFLAEKAEEEARDEQDEVISNIYPEAITFNRDANMEQKIEMLASFCERYNIDIAPTYIDYVRMAMSLHAALGERGYSYFSRFCHLYSRGTMTESEIRQKWEQTACVRSIGAGTLFYLAKKAGININNL